LSWQLEVRRFSPIVWLGERIRVSWFGQFLDQGQQFSRLNWLEHEFRAKMLSWLRGLDRKARHHDGWNGVRGQQLSPLNAPSRHR
jgi:hypothetical protein